MGQLWHYYHNPTIPTTAHNTLLQFTTPYHSHTTLHHTPPQPRNTHHSSQHSTTDHNTLLQSITPYHSPQHSTTAPQHLPQLTTPHHHQQPRLKEGWGRKKDGCRMGRRAGVDITWPTHSRAHASPECLHETCTRPGRQIWKVGYDKNT